MKSLSLATLLVAFVIQAADCADHQLAGVEIRNLRLNTANDNYQAIEIPGFSSEPAGANTRIRPGEVRQIKEPLSEGVTGVSLVGVVFEDTTAFGETDLLDRLEKRRRLDIEIQTESLAAMSQIRLSLNPGDTVQKAIARIESAPPQDRSEKDLFLLQTLEQIQNQLKLGRSPTVAIPIYERIAQARLERAKAQAHFRRAQ